MDVLALSFFFSVSLIFLVLALIFNSKPLFFISSMLMILFGYMMLTYGVTESILTGKNETQSFGYIINASTNLTQLNSVTTTGAYTNRETKNDYTNGFGTVFLAIGGWFAASSFLDFEDLKHKIGIG